MVLDMSDWILFVLYTGLVWLTYKWKKFNLNVDILNSYVHKYMTHITSLSVAIEPENLITLRTISKRLRVLIDMWSQSRTLCCVHDLARWRLNCLGINYCCSSSQEQLEARFLIKKFNGNETVSNRIFHKYCANIDRSWCWVYAVSNTSESSSKHTRDCVPLQITSYLWKCSDLSYFDCCRHCHKLLKHFVRRLNRNVECSRRTIFLPKRMK